MPDQEQVPERGRDEAEETASDEASAEQDESSKDVLEDADELLDEIDGVLEENAEEFVKNYVQKGGQ